MPITAGSKSSRKFFAMMFTAKGLVALILFASCATALRAQAIEIRLVNGRNGRPWTGAACVIVSLGNRPNKRVFTISTDKNGIARLRLTNKDSEVDVPKILTRCASDGTINPVLKYDDTLTVYTTLYNPSCAFPESIPHARLHDIAFSTNEVLQHGVASANTCGKVTASPQPGEVILFVRHRNHKEKRHDCLAGEFPILCW